uniref:Uncharacterized protein n=1 Tax=Arion vulgaris TaxID=1028688 RepID=A0A0B7AVW8_9EUPU
MLHNIRLQCNFVGHEVMQHILDRSHGSTNLIIIDRKKQRRKITLKPKMKLLMSSRFVRIQASLFGYKLRQCVARALNVSKEQ